MLIKFWLKRKKRIALGFDEAHAFDKVRDRAENRCEITWEYVNDKYARCFAHILGKWMYPNHRTNINNIIFVKNINIHRYVDSAVAGNKYELEEMLDKWLSLIPIVQQLVRNKYPFLNPKWT